MITETRKIGDNDYTVTMLPLAQWQALRNDIWPTLMGILPGVIDDLGDHHLPTREQLVDVVRSVSVMLPLQPAAYERIIKLLHACSSVSGQPGYLSNVAEMYWAKIRYAEMGEWLAFALEVQIVPFLSGLPLVSLHRLARVKASLSPSMSTGRHGDSFGRDTEH